MSVWWIRHTRVNVEPGVCYGRTDVPLAETFVQDAVAVKLALPKVPVLVWTSPAKRCLKLAESLGGEVRVDERLRELNFGEWEGRHWETFHDARSEAWARDPWSLGPPGGESGLALSERVAEVRAEILTEARRHRGLMAVVTHAGVLRAWRYLRGDLSRDEAVAWDVPFGSVWADRL